MLSVRLHLRLPLAIIVDHAEFQQPALLTLNSPFHMVASHGQSIPLI